VLTTGVCEFAGGWAARAVRERNDAAAIKTIDASEIAPTQMAGINIFEDGLDTTVLLGKTPVMNPRNTA
jgi:hypothetical protein